MFAKPENMLMGRSRSSCSLRGGAAEDERLAARLRDLLGRDAGERMRAHGDGLGQVAVAEDLDALALPLDEAAIAQRALVDLCAGREHVQVTDVDRRGRDRERVVEPALREATLDGRLAAFEVG